MFISKQRSARPSYLIIDGCNVEVFDEFKFHGITIDHNLIIDFKKAFILINPCILFLKWFHYSFDNNSLALFTDY